LFVMEQFADVNAWTESDMISIISQCAFENSSVEEFSNYDMLKIHLLASLEPKLTLKERDFLKQSLVQWEGESVLDFYQRCEDIQSQLCEGNIMAEKWAEQDVIMNFIAGLNSDIRDKLLEKMPSNASDFLHEAIKLESTFGPFKDVSNFLSQVETKLEENEDNKDFFSRLYIQM